MAHKRPTQIDRVGRLCAGLAEVIFRALERQICYHFNMSSGEQTSRLADQLAEKARRQDMEHLQAIEGNPLDAEDRAMFAMFEREGWSHERCLAYIREQALKAAAPQAAE